MLRTLTTLLLSLSLLPACIDDTTEPADDLPDQVTWRDATYVRADLDGRLPQGPGVADLAGKSREELADLLRPMIIHPNGGAYTLATPNWEGADAVFAPAQQILRTPRPDEDGVRPTEDAAATMRRVDTASDAPIDQLGLAAPEVASIVIGADNRALSTTGVNPFNAIARVRVFTAGDGGGHRIDCTGSWIGQWTFVLAGHCLRFPDGAFAQRIIIEQARAGGSLPFGTLDCNNADAATGNNFLAGVPVGYLGAIDDPLNFGVIDVFPCSATGVPAARRFNGFVVDSGSTGYNMHGYPIGRCPNAIAEGTFMCGMGDFGYVNGHRLESQLDGTAGQDGAPWWTVDPTRVAGVHLGYRQYFDFGRCGFDECKRQFARRIDQVTDAFLRSISFDF